MKIKTLIIILSVSLTFLFTSCIGGQEDLIMSSTSPNDAYKVEVYKSNGGATVDFSIKAYLVNDGKKTLIYNKYHDYDAEIIWIDNEIVSINGITLNLSEGETYDWRDD